MTANLAANLVRIELPVKTVENFLVKVAEITGYINRDLRPSEFLDSVLLSCSIQPFTIASAKNLQTRVSGEASKKFKRVFRERRLNASPLFLALLGVVGVSEMVIAWSEHIFVVTACIVGSLALGASKVIFDEYCMLLERLEWLREPLDGYSGYIPSHVLETAMRLKEADDHIEMGVEHFGDDVGFLVAEYHVRNQRVDVFASSYIEFWERQSGIV